MSPAVWAILLGLGLGGWILATILGCAWVYRWLCNGDPVSRAFEAAVADALAVTDTAAGAPAIDHDTHGLKYTIRAYRCGCQRIYSGTGQLTNELACPAAKPYEQETAAR